MIDLTSARKVLSAFLSLVSGVSSFRVERYFAFSNLRRACTAFGKSGLKRPTKACRMNGRLRMSVGPASDGYSLVYDFDEPVSAFEKSGSGAFRVPVMSLANTTSHSRPVCWCARHRLGVRPHLCSPSMHGRLPGGPIGERCGRNRYLCHDHWQLQHYYLGAHEKDEEQCNRRQYRSLRQRDRHGWS